MRALLALGALCLLVSAVGAEDKPPPKADKKICRRQEVTGSVIPEHVCMTKAQWDQFDAQIAERNKAFLDRRANDGGLTSGPH